MFRTARRQETYTKVLEDQMREQREELKRLFAALQEIEKRSDEWRHAHRAKHRHSGTGHGHGHHRRHSASYTPNSPQAQRSQTTPNTSSAGTTPLGPIASSLANLRKDADTLGTLNVFTLEYVCESLGLDLHTNQQIRTALVDLDRDGSGTINFARFFEFMMFSGQNEVGKEPRERESSNFATPTLAAIRKQQANHLLFRALSHQLVIPEWETFCKQCVDILEAVRSNESGANADYIPELANAPSDRLALSICTVDGQVFNYGDFNCGFSIQSCHKPLNYALAIEEHGLEEVHKYVGYEPSGVAFNAFTLLEDENGKRPHNPMINAGAIVTSSLVQKQLPMSDRYGYVTERYARMAAVPKLGFCQTVYLSEKATADRNHALVHFMRGARVFRHSSNPSHGLDSLDFYTQCCSVEFTAQRLAAVAGTLANSGVCPLTGERCLRPSSVAHTLKLMFSSGMYDYSGEWAMTIGLPAKSGVAGAVFLVVPNVMGVCVFSPKLDERGNSVRAVDFFTRFSKAFPVGMFDLLLSEQPSFAAAIGASMAQLPTSSEEVHLPLSPNVVEALSPRSPSRPSAIPQVSRAVSLSELFISKLSSAAKSRRLDSLSNLSSNDPQNRFPGLGKRQTAPLTPSEPDDTKKAESKAPSNAPAFPSAAPTPAAAPAPGLPPRSSIIPRQLQEAMQTTGAALAIQNHSFALNPEIDLRALRPISGLRLGDGPDIASLSAISESSPFPSAPPAAAPVGAAPSPTAAADVKRVSQSPRSSQDVPLTSEPGEKTSPGSPRKIHASSSGKLSDLLSQAGLKISRQQSVFHTPIAAAELDETSPSPVKNSSDSHLQRGDTVIASAAAALAAVERVAGSSPTFTASTNSSSVPPLASRSSSNNSPMIVPKSASANSPRLTPSSPDSKKQSNFPFLPPSSLASQSVPRSNSATSIVSRLFGLGGSKTTASPTPPVATPTSPTWNDSLQRREKSRNALALARDRKDATKRRDDVKSPPPIFANNDSDDDLQDFVNSSEGATPSSVFDKMRENSQRKGKTGSGGIESVHLDHVAAVYGLLPSPKK